MSDSNGLGQIETKKKSGQERFTLKGQERESNLLDFWRWAYSDLVGNTERGKLAEYIVAMALGIHEDISVTWDRYDLCSKEGIAVEVKTSGYLQTWQQSKHSDIRFGIPSTHGWDPVTNSWEKDKRRQADVYVFCLHHHTDSTTINPMDIDQWTFYVISTARLDSLSDNPKSIGLSRLIQEGARECSFDSLQEMVLWAADLQNRCPGTQKAIESTIG